MKNFVLAVPACCRFASDSQYWIGENAGFLYPTTDNQLTWTDGSTNSTFSVEYITDAAADAEDGLCVSVDSAGKWHKEACNASRGYVCKRNEGGEHTNITLVTLLYNYETQFMFSFKCNRCCLYAAVRFWC